MKLNHARCRRNSNNRIRLYISVFFIFFIFPIIYKYTYLSSIEINAFQGKRYYESHNIGLGQAGNVSYETVNSKNLGRRLFNNRDHFILSIDGGGIFGVVPLLQLKKLTKCLEEKDGTRDLHKYFDIIAGNSTGSIIAAGLVTPSEKDPARGSDVNDLYDMYVQRGKEIFPDVNKGYLSLFENKAYYNNAGRKKVFEDVLKDHISNEALSDFVIPFFDTYFGPVYFTRDHGAHRKALDGSILVDAEHSKAKMSDLVMYSSSAPMYFNPYKGKETYTTSEDGLKKTYLPYTAYDGALYQNNPSLLAIMEARRDFQGGHFHLVSLGTGISYRGSMLGPLNIADQGIQKSNSNLFFAILPSTMDSSAWTIDEFLRTDSSIEYYRINVPLKEGLDLSMDNASEEHIDAIKKSVDASSDMNDPIISNICQELSDFKPGLGKNESKK